MTCHKKTVGAFSLSKSLYLRGLQCHKSLWLHKFRPELKDDVSNEAQARFDTGHSVGDLARELYPGGVLVPFEVDGIRVPVEEQLRQTREAIRAGMKVIYEASFDFDGTFVKVDILRKIPSGWVIYEVKSSARVKDCHCHDAALQYHVVTGAGLSVNRVFVVHLNTEYVRDGRLDLKKLFVKEDVTKNVRELLPVTVAALNTQRAMLAKKTPPKIDIGPYCSEPYDCDFQGHCWSHIPEDSVFDLRERGVDRYALYRQGIVRQKDIPLDLLNAKQRQQVVATLKKQYHVDRNKVREFLATLKYPLYFLDLETFMSGVPLYDDIRPYQQVPFQYSLHYQKRRGGKLRHAEFLAQPGEDPRRSLVHALMSAIPVGATVLAYNMQFEAGALKSLAELYPEHQEKTDGLIANMRDLMVPFRRREVYHWRMKGGYSIKDVLPALVPGLSYSGLEICDGGAAMAAYHEMCALQDLPEELAVVRNNLLEYCKLDTLAMVRILEVLYSLVQ